MTDQTTAARQAIVERVEDCRRRLGVFLDALDHGELFEEFDSPYPDLRHPFGGVREYGQATDGRHESEVRAYAAAANGIRAAGALITALLDAIENIASVPGFSYDDLRWSLQTAWEAKEGIEDALRAVLHVEDFWRGVVQSYGYSPDEWAELWKPVGDSKRGITPTPPAVYSVPFEALRPISELRAALADPREDQPE
jgi:hypothetical protein